MALTNYKVASTPEVFFKKAVLKKFAVFTGNHLCWSPFLINLRAERPIVKFLRTPI